MAHELDFSLGRAGMAYFGQTPWHGLGVVLTEEETRQPEIIMEKSGLAWDVEEHAINFEPDENTKIIIPGMKTLVRSDTMTPLSVVASSYNVVQPKQVMDFYKHFVERHGFRIVTAGSLAGGKRIWALAEVGKEFTVKGNDTVKAYLLFATSFDRTLATTIQFTSVRVVCQNTLEFSIQGDNETSIKIPHSMMFDEEQVQFDIEEMAGHWTNFEDNAKELSTRIVTREETVQYFLDLLYPNETVEEMGKRKQNNLKNVVELFHNGQGQQEAGQTAWGLLNAVTRYVDHEKGRNRDSALNSAWFGVGKDLKQKAYTKALKMVA